MTHDNQKTFFYGHNSAFTLNPMFVKSQDIIAKEEAKRLAKEKARLFEERLEAMQPKRVERVRNECDCKPNQCACPPFVYVGEYITTISF